MLRKSGSGGRGRGEGEVGGMSDDVFARLWPGASWPRLDASLARYVRVSLTRKILIGPPLFLANRLTLTLATSWHHESHPSIHPICYDK